MVASNFSYIEGGGGNIKFPLFYGRGWRQKVYPVSGGGGGCTN